MNERISTHALPSAPFDKIEIAEQPNTQSSLTEYDRFKAGLRQVLSVPKEELDRREAEWQHQQAEKKKQKK